MLHFEDKLRVCRDKGSSLVCHPRAAASDDAASASGAAEQLKEGASRCRW